MKGLSRNPFRLRSSNKTDFGVCSSEERTAILSYLLNIVRAGLGRSFDEEVFNFCVDVLGTKKAFQLLKSHYPDDLEQQHRDSLYFWAAGKTSDGDTSRIIHTLFIPYIESMARRGRGRSNRELLSRLTLVKQTFRLTPVEMSILLFYYLIQARTVVSKYLAKDPLDLTQHQTFKDYGHLVLGLNRRSFRSIMRSSALFDTTLIMINDEGLSIDGSVYDYLLGIGNRELTNTCFSLGADTDLQIEDFSISSDELNVLKALLRSRDRCNILLYGPPGTGKTSLTKCLAKHLKKELYSVRVDEGGNDYGFRLKAIYATLNAAQRENSLVLIDEADEILNTEQSFLKRSKNEADKSWINNVLDSHDRKIIWIVNNHSDIERSTMRRFNFTLELNKLSARNRLVILKHELAKYRIENYLSESEMRALCRTYAIDASGIVHAARLLKIKGSVKKEAALSMVKTVMINHEITTTGECINKIHKDFKNYTLQGLNASYDLNGLVAIMGKYQKLRNQSEKPFISLLLHGLPGTGKSEFVYYLGNRLGNEVIHKRASDIQDAFVGQTEKNIAQAFREAQNDNAILFFDEADSFFFPRKNAIRSWEKSFTNELLAQLDDYRGIVAFATNDKEGLDHAALRRFRFKIEFRPLLPEGIVIFYNSLLAPLVKNRARMNDDEIRRLTTLKNLTPGDFAVIKDRHSFIAGNAPSHAELIDELIQELGHKTVVNRIGY